MKSFRLCVAGALGLAFLPIPGSIFQLVVPPVYAEAPAKQAPCTWSRFPAIRLPLQIDERTRANLTEIKLFVKAPDTEWALVQAGPPTQNSFDYHADKDGAYAFMFVTVDKAGRSFPPNFEARPPHQLIVVDTVPPELSVMPMPFANRDIYLQVRMEDANPDRATIRLEYAVGENSWREMELAQADSPGVFRIPHASILEGRVKATAKDKAGNLALRIVDLGDSTQSFVNEKSRETPSHPQEAVKSEPPLALPIDVPEIAAAPTPRQTSAKLADSFEIQIPVPDLKAVASTSSEKRVTTVAASNSAPVLQPAPPIVDPKVADSQNIVPASDLRFNTAATDNPYFPPLPSQAAPVKNDPPVVKQELAPRKLEAPTVDARPSALAQGSPEIINTPRCTLDYAVENVVIGGQPKIEFWATRDNGRTWMRVQDESGGRTPAKLVLPGDGVYGVRVKANGNGQSPHMGEAPDAWIEVDTTRPTVRLMPPTIGTGADAGTLTIQWMAHDRNLVADSISIYHASRPDGPWLPIATGLRNEGSYRWLIPSGIATDIFLRLEAIDRAGNVGQSDLQDPIVLPQPRVRVLGIGPAR